MGGLQNFCDVVTKADTTVQRCIVASLQTLFPNLKVIGEEVGVKALFLLERENYARTHARTHTHTHTHVRPHHIHTHTYTHIHTHARTHTHTHIM